MSNQNLMAVPDLALPQSCDSTVQIVRWRDLPLACPMHGTSLWNAHQRVYLPIHLTGREKCYNCGTVYMLEELDPDAPTPEFSDNKIEKYYHRERERVLAAREAARRLPPAEES